MDNNMEIVETFMGLTKNIVSFYEGNLLKKANISCSELNVLRILFEYEKKNQKINITELALSMKITKSAASQLISKLEKKGFVKRKLNLFDKKVNYISVTDSARKGYEENCTKYHKMIEKVSNDMGEKDSKELSKLLQKLSDIINNIGEAEEIC
jgi:DNA-binding MarR family transcriptional regulator